MPAPLGPARSETRQTPPGARPNRRAQPRLRRGERCAAQPSGRPHEPSGNRRPQMDDRRRDAESAVQNSAYRPPRWRLIAGPIPSARLSPRPAGRCAPPCTRCRPASPSRGRPGAPGSSDPGTGTPPRRCAPPPTRAIESPVRAALDAVRRQPRRIEVRVVGGERGGERERHGRERISEWLVACNGSAAGSLRPTTGAKPTTAEIAQAMRRRY